MISWFVNLFVVTVIVIIWNAFGAAWWVLVALLAIYLALKEL